MRIDAKTGRLVRRTPERPSRASRIVHGCLGALLGGTIGYGLVTAAPEPPSLLEPGALAWILGLAAVFGGLSAWSPRAFWRSGGRFRWSHPDDPDD